MQKGGDMAREREIQESLRLKAAAAQLHVFLGGMDYPAQKQQLIDHAKSKSAPQNVIQLLNRLPERKYDRSADIQREVSKIT